MSTQNRNKVTDLENELSVVGEGERIREGIVQEFGMDTYTLLHLNG